MVRYDPRMPEDATKPKAADALDGLTVQELETRGAELRRLIADRRAGAFVPRDRYFDKVGQPDGLTASQDYMMRLSLLEIEAWRGELDDVKAELRDRREEARAVREQRILDSTRWATWAAAIAAAAAVAPTVWALTKAAAALLKR